MEIQKPQYCCSVIIKTKGQKTLHLILILSYYFRLMWQWRCEPGAVCHLTILTWGVFCSSHTATAAAGIQGEHQKYPHCSYQHHALSNLPFPLTPYWQDPPHDHDLIFVSPLLLTAPIISLLVIQANVQYRDTHTWFDCYVLIWWFH